ncbi:MAG TPA: alpha-L-arabinofuranosidase C-terminal domain-containing protein [Armatimonadota bacterium]|jgi:alpha-N-arabinofuranosidase
MEGRLTVWTDHELSVINPNLYGNFAEHIGRCVYGGLWVGEKSTTPNEEGLRSDVVGALRQLRLPVLRWPGGCFADDYHWEWGVGPERESRRNLWWGGADSNAFGTDEFLRLCRQVGCAPYISANVGSGTVEEAGNWMEYCNCSQDSRYAHRRRQNGHAEPYGVRYWGIGNENWGCGGQMAPQQYAYECRKYACFMRKLGPEVEGGVYLIAAGHEDLNWLAGVLQHLEYPAGLIDAISIHMYRSGHPAVGPGAETRDATPEHYYRLLGEVVDMEDKVRKSADLTDYYSTRQHKLELVVDEWGTWYSDADAGYCQQSPLKDGLFTAAALHMFQRYAGAVSMTNMAQVANLLQSLVLTRGSEMVLTPTYHAYEMMKDHMGATLLASRASSAGLADDKGREYDALSVSASRSAAGRITLSVVNQSLDQDCRTEINLSGLTEVSGVTARVLTSASQTDVNDFEEGERVAPQATPVAATGPVFTHTFPAKSLTVLEVSP